MLQKEISDYITRNNSPYSSDVSLPGKVSAGKISYRFVLDKPSLIFLLLGAISAIIVFFAALTDHRKKMKLRETQLVFDYPQIVSNLLLLTDAGLTIRMAFTQILKDYKKKENPIDHYAYTEIELMLNKLKSGHSEYGSYAEFGKRCQLHSYIKLGSILEQNLRKGSSDLYFSLKQEVSEAFLQHKTTTLQSGERAGTKLLLPMILLLIVIMALIIIPAFLSMSAL